MRQPLRKNTTYFVVFLENRTLYYYINLSTDLFTYTLLVLHKILSTTLDIWLKKLSYTVYFKFYLKCIKCIVQLHASTNLTGKKWIKMNTDKKKNQIIKTNKIKSKINSPPHKRTNKSKFYWHLHHVFRLFPPMKASIIL